MIPALRKEELMLDAEEIVRKLDLKLHPVEGGYFSETYRSEETLRTGRSGQRHRDSRSLATAIYYLLKPGTVSSLHRLAGDELFHFYLGDPVEMLQLHPGGRSRLLVLGTDLEAGMRPQVLVPRGVWQGSRLVPGGRLALLGTTMAPGFDPDDYEQGEFGVLSAAWPQHRDLIRTLLPG